MACVYRPCYHDTFFFDLEKEDMPSYEDVMDAFNHRRDLETCGINYMLTVEGTAITRSIDVRWMNGEKATFQPIGFQCILENFKEFGECYFCYLSIKYPFDAPMPRYSY